MVPVKIDGEVQQLEKHRASIGDGLGLARKDRKVARVRAMPTPSRSPLLFLAATLVFSFNALHPVKAADRDVALSNSWIPATTMIVTIRCPGKKDCRILLTRHGNEARRDRT